MCPSSIVAVAMRCAMAVSRQIITYLFPDPSNRQTNSLVTSTNCLSVTIQLKSIEFFCPSAVIEKWVDCRQTNSLVSSTRVSVCHIMGSVCSMYVGVCRIRWLTQAGEIVV